MPQRSLAPPEDPEVATAVGAAGGGHEAEEDAPGCCTEDEAAEAAAVDRLAAPGSSAAEGDAPRLSLSATALKPKLVTIKRCLSTFSHFTFLLKVRMHTVWFAEITVLTLTGQPFSKL